MQTRFRSATRTRFFAVASLVVIVLFLELVRAQDPIETIRIDSDLVDLKVSVLGVAPDAAVPMLPRKTSLCWKTAGRRRSRFSLPPMRLDLVLLLDLSGSNEKKLKMIRNSAKRFVEATRPTDRVALVSFTRATGALFIFHAGSDEAEKEHRRNG